MQHYVVLFSLREEASDMIFSTNYLMIDVFSLSVPRA